MFSIQAYDNHIGSDIQQTISAREMHLELQIKYDFSTWVRDQIKRLQLIENEDYVVFQNLQGNPHGGRPRSEYYFTIDIAKHVALASHTPKGREYRQALIDLEAKVQSARISNASHPSTMEDQISYLRSLLQLSEDFDLTDDHTRMIARETIQNGLRQPFHPQPQMLAERNPINDYFQVEDLREEICSAHNLKNSQWAEMRGSFGKVIRANIQAADPSAEPIRIKKMVNGAEREVNGWENGYRNIAIAAIENCLERHKQGK